MKRIICRIMAILFAMGASFTNVTAATAPKAMNQAVWMASIYNIDFPSVKNNATIQKREYEKNLDRLKAIGINSVIVQVRPKADALYKSQLNPWSDVVTGIQGKNPGYDPMKFMIDAAHKRGMTFQAWLNPYRITTAGTDVKKLASNHPARLHPEWTMKFKNALYYNPEIEGVKGHIVDTVKEIVDNYDVDGVVFDDYFYPSNYPLPKGEKKDGVVANARRQSINDMVERVSHVLREKDVTFGISPPGIWKNKATDSTGSETKGNQSYYSVYADTRTWIKNGWIDYVSPQIYWEAGNPAADYETLVKWWSDEVKGTNVKLYISQCLYKDEVAGEIGEQLEINQKYPEVSGSFYYNMKSLLTDRGGCKTQIQNYNSGSIN